ncbi:aldehyde ferredoxin oxidoreductase N-terminal domain-containing protein [Chloroflexota bacterium]
MSTLRNRITMVHRMETLGYSGEILRIDLSSKSSDTFATVDYAERFIGGRGIATKIYWDEVKPEVKPFDEQNWLVIMTGPLAGFKGLSGSRWIMCGKSPATTPEQFSYCNLGGSWGAQLKFAGYDGIAIHGKSDKPVYLLIEDRSVQLRDASHLWGRNAVEVREALKDELGRSVRVLATGPAGDNLVTFATVLADEDSCGSAGFGAVMGSKMLKAIAVRGTRKIKVADSERVWQLSRTIRELTRGNTTRGLVPGPKMKKAPCYGCISGCTRTVCEAKDGTKGKFMCEPSVFYYAMARKYYVDWDSDAEEVPFYAARLCDKYGVDVSSISALIGWLFRCHRAGILTDDTTGIPISKMGSLEFIETLVRKVSLRDGFGDVLAMGIFRAAESIGTEARKMITDYVSKAGQSVAYDPRMFIAHGLMYAVEPRKPINQLHEIGLPLYDWLEWINGVEGAYLTSEVFRNIGNRFWGSELAVDFSTYEGKALAVKNIQDRQYAKESLVVCDFGPWPVLYVRNSKNHIGDPTLESCIFSAITGRAIDEVGLYEVGERIFNLQRAILVREGHHGREADRIDEHFYTLPLKTMAVNPECLAPGTRGEVISRKGEVLNKDMFEVMKDEYYMSRGWDVASGLQTLAKLDGLGLGDVAVDMVERGFIV